VLDLGDASQSLNQPINPLIYLPVFGLSTGNSTHRQPLGKQPTLSTRWSWLLTVKRQRNCSSVAIMKGM